MSMYGLGMLKGMFVTLKHLGRKPITAQYPEQPSPLPRRFRGYEFAWDEQRCTGCASCAKACPHGCITVTTSPGEAGRYHVDRFEIDVAFCLVCVLCVEACPYDALFMGSSIEWGSFRRDDLIIKKDRFVAQYEEQRKDPSRLPSAYLRPDLEPAPGEPLPDPRGRVAQ
jgi:NADH-quinone oxidoreductase chain I